jgi:hypothetical protein
MTVLGSLQLCCLSCRQTAQCLRIMISNVLGLQVALELDRGLSWEAAESKFQTYLESDYAVTTSKNGYYISDWTDNVGGTGHPFVLLATEQRPAYRR